MSNYYDWMFNGSPSVAMDGGKRIVYRRHPDGSPCYAEDPNDCPLVQHHRKAEEADALTKPMKVQSRDAFQKRMTGLVAELNKTGWTEALSRKVNRAVDDVLDGRSLPTRMPSDTMTRDRMVDIPKWFLAAYHLACGTDNPKTGSHDSVEANRVVEKALKGMGQWTPNIYGKCQRAFGKPFGEGSEAYVFSQKGGLVSKASTLGHTPNLVVAMERLMLSNILFPEVAQKVKGMGSMHGDTTNRPNEHISFELVQPKLKFKYLKTDADADRAMRKLGFTRDYGDEFVDKAGEIRLLDLKRVNLPVAKDGSILFIDSPAVLNYGKEGTLGVTDYLVKHGKKNTIR